MVVFLSVLSMDYTNTNKVSVSLVCLSLWSVILPVMGEFRWWESSKGQLVQCPAWSSPDLKVGWGCSGPPAVQFENLPRWSSTVTACLKAQSLWDFFFFFFWLSLLFFCCVSWGNMYFVHCCIPLWNGWMGICYCNVSCLLPLAGWASLAPLPVLQSWMLQPHCGLTGRPPVIWHLDQFVSTFLFVLGSPEVSVVLLVWFPICLIKG